MASITNKDILRMIDYRDGCSVYHRNEIREARESAVSFFWKKKEVENKHIALEELRGRLVEERYKLTADDVDLLRKYNIFTRKHYSEESSSPTLKELINEEASGVKRNTSDNLSTAKNCLHNYFISDLYVYRESFFDVNHSIIPLTISDEEFIEIIDSYNGQYGFSYSSDDYAERYNMYKKVFTLDFIIQKLADKYNDLDKVTAVFDTFLLGSKEFPSCDLSCFPKDEDISFFAEMLDPINMIKVLGAHGCRNMNEYITNKTTINKKGNYKVKTI